MFIHFTFGTLGKQGKVEEQTQAVIEYILRDGRLKVSKCKEFLPAFPQPGTKRIPREKFKVTEDGLAATFNLKEDPDSFSKLPDDKTIQYLPVDVPMICFIKISFNQLKNSTHSNEYGKFGIVLTDGFLKASGIRPVYYYTEESLWNDSLIKRWNYVAKTPSERGKTELEKEILSFRKPASLFPTFRESVITKIIRASNGVQVEYLTYDRYREGYDFTKEKEYRIVLDKSVEYLYFEEGDMYMIITPDLEAKKAIETFLNQNWREKPKVEVYPT